ncbi:DUF2809 domain-containing protein [Flavobacterium sp. RHBU_24]|uniref:ribosomal maturation YjgA family protein n=1 Tax=Flavobacterium sp. RHBU_24 TaxID=3391185 RepID=UPI00398525E3
MKPQLSARQTYAVLIIFIVPIGLYLRYRDDWFPDIVNLYLGDVLYATLFFFLFSIAFPGHTSLRRAGYALAACYVIELLQLYRAPWMLALRDTKPGGLILGHQFLWSDLLAYFIGVALGYGTDIIWRKPGKIDS